MKNELRYTPDLQLFAGEGAEGVNGETGADDAVAGQNSAVEMTADDEFSELINGLMAIPNLIALFLLSGTVIKLIKQHNEARLK